MAVHQIESMDGYVKFIQQTPEEEDALFRDMLIGVTSFFRDPEAFKALEEQIIPKLFAGKHAESAIRIWVPGCSTGEEAYSLAILVFSEQTVIYDPPFSKLDLISCRDLITSLHKAAGTRETIRCPGLQVRTNGDVITVNLIVRPVAAAADSREPPLYLVILEQAQEPMIGDKASLPGEQDSKPSSAPDSEDADTRIAALKHELRVKE